MADITPEQVPEEWVRVAHAHYSMHGAGLIRNILAGVAPLIAAAERERVAERIARHVEDFAGNYPEDVFPPGSDSRDAISGTAMRHAYLNAARSIREDWPVQDEEEQS
jgi:hypothetical protein